MLHDEETHDDTEYSHLSEALYEADTHPPEDETDKEASEITIPYC